MISSSCSMALTFSIIIKCLLICVLPAALGNSPGEVIPKQIELEIGHSVNITCRMNLEIFPGADSRSLTFIQEDTKQPVPRDDIHILNESTIVYTMRNATKQNRYYSCTSGQYGVDQTHVFVGTKPLEITDFKCRGYDYVYMVCNFTIPENTVATIYNVSYTAQSVNYHQNCELEIDNQQAICNLTSARNNYRYNYELFNFFVTGYNALGSVQQNFKIHHIESIIPARPNIKIQNITTNSALLRWRMVRFSYYRKGLVYEVLVKPENMSWLLNYDDFEIQNTTADYSIRLKNLPYAFYTFTVSVRLRIPSKNAEWSEAFIGNFKTLPKIPDAPPQMDSSSFYIANENQVRLYWLQLPFQHYNGANFSYVITEIKINGVVEELKPKKIDLISATFDWDRRKSYEFKIKSRNHLGESEQASSIFIPSMPKSTESITPQWISNVYHEPSRRYTISWKSPAQQKDLVDFTVFWCQSKNALIDDCKDALQFQHVEKTTNRFTTPPLEQEHTWNLAVSANYKNFSSGMHWTMCTADISSDLVKMEPEIQPLDSHTIKIQWSLDRICTSLLEGYNLTYCEVQPIDDQEMDCVNGNSTLTVEKSQKEFRLQKLKPYTTYKLEMWMFSKQKVGRSSDIQFITTLEDASLEPRDLRFENVTSNSAWIFWKPPSIFNGIVRYYKILQNHEEHIVINCTRIGSEDICKNGTEDEIRFQLLSLSSFTTYDIQVVAHTVKDSKPSDKITFRTLIGIPSSPEQTNITDDNHMTLFEWEKPKIPAGRLDFYEVALTIWYNNEKKEEYISSILDATSCRFKIPTCEGINFSHTLEIRAVNVVSLNEEIDQNILAINEAIANQEHNSDYNRPENSYLECLSTSSLSADRQEEILQSYKDPRKYVQLKSPWMRGQIFRCGPPPKKFVIALFLSFGSLILICGMVAVIFFAHKEYRKMANIKCAVPEALNTSFPTKDPNGIDNNHHLEDDDFKKSKDFTTTEVQNLLSSGFNDSGYLINDSLSDGVLGDNGGITPISLGKSSGYSGSDHYDANNDCATDKIFDFSMLQNRHPHHQHHHQRPFDSYMIMELPNEDESNSPTQPIKTNSNGYTDASEFMNGFLPKENAYIKPNKTFGWPTSEMSNNIFTMEDNSRKSDFNNAFGMGNGGVGEIGAGGSYVSPQLFMKTNSNGYTTLEALGKPSQPSSLTTTSSNNSHTFEGGGISGYVTQKELSEFGRGRLS